MNSIQPHSPTQNHPATFFSKRRLSVDGKAVEGQRRSVERHDAVDPADTQVRHVEPGDLRMAELRYDGTFVSPAERLAQRRAGSASSNSVMPGSPDAIIYRYPIRRLDDVAISTRDERIADYHRLAAAHLRLAHRIDAPYGKATNAAAPTFEEAIARRAEARRERSEAYKYIAKLAPHVELTKWFERLSSSARRGRPA